MPLNTCRTKDELAQWADKAGHQRPEWTEWKVKLAGSEANFNKMLEAANTTTTYFVHDV